MKRALIILTLTAMAPIMGMDRYIYTADDAQRLLEKMRYLERQHEKALADLAKKTKEERNDPKKSPLERATPSREINLLSELVVHLNYEYVEARNEQSAAQSDAQRSNK
jgi:hypothetical protein